MPCHVFIHIYIYIYIYIKTYKPVRKRFGSVRFVSKIKRFLWPAVRFGSLIIVCGSVRFGSVPGILLESPVRFGSVRQSFFDLTALVRFGF